MRALLIVDMQRDFVETGGTLSFSASSTIVEPVLALTKEFIERGDVIFTTQDWHDKSDEEFTLW
ncbi:MAG: cysteine hydrolase, partial [Thermotogae bacterium]